MILVLHRNDRRKSPRVVLEETGESSFTAYCLPPTAYCLLPTAY